MDARRAGSRGQSRFRFLREIAGAVRLANPSDEVGTRAYGASGIKSYTIRLLEDARPIMPQFGHQLNRTGRSWFINILRDDSTILNQHFFAAATVVTRGCGSRGGEKMRHATAHVGQDTAP